MKRTNAVKIGSLWEAPKKEDASIVADLEEQAAQGIVVGAAPQHPMVGARTNKKGGSWDPTELTPKMLHIMDLQLFNPTIKADQIAEIVDLSASRVRGIISSAMYRAKFNLRRLKIEKLQHSKIAEERDKFSKLRDEMIDAHKNIMLIDPNQHAGKELELEKLKQRSVSDLLRMSTDQLREIDRKLSGDNGGRGEVSAEIEVDTSDPRKAYLRLMSSFRKGSK